MKSRLALAALLSISTASFTALGEVPWVENPELGQGEGLPLGKLELHPSLAAEFGYDTNYFRRGPNDRGPDGEPLPILDTLRLRFTPSLTLVTAQRPVSESSPPPLVRFRLDTRASASYSLFIPLDDTNEFENRNRLNGGIGAGFELFPQRKLTWDGNASYQRALDPSSVGTGDLDFDRDSLQAGTGLTWRPGGGLFEWRAGYTWRGTYFTEDDYSVFNNGQHAIETRGRYRFLPRTAALFRSEYRFVRYSDTGSDQVLTDGETLRSQLGIAGLFTTRFAFRAMAGWAASFFKARNGIDPQNYDGPVGNAEVKWFVSPTRDAVPESAIVNLSSVALGYEHSYAHSYLGPFYKTDRGYLTLEYFIGGVIVTSLQGYVAYIKYPDFVISPEPGAEVFTDVSETRLGARLFAEYRFARNVGLNSTISYDRNISDDEFDLAPDDPMNGSRDDLEYKRFQAFVGVRVFW